MDKCDSNSRNWTLRSEIPHPGEVDPDFQKLTPPEYLIQRAQEHVSRCGKELLLSIDAITGEEITYWNYLTWSNNAASWFQDQGLERGSVVLYLIDNFTKLPAFFTGVWKANGVLRASYPEELPDTIRERIIESNCAFVYCEANKLISCLEAVRGLEWEITIILNDGRPSPNGPTNSAVKVVSIQQVFEHEGGSAAAPPLLVTPADPALILCTSGTTGRTKGALRTHRSLLNLIKSEEMYPWEPKSLLICKGTHISGSCFPLGNLALGICSVIVWKADREIIYRAITRHKPTVVFGFPGFLLWLKQVQDRSDLDSLTKLFTAGYVLGPEVKKRLLTVGDNVETVLNIYGMTESSHFISSCVQVNMSDGGKGVQFRGIDDVPGNAVGRVAPGGQVQIRDPATSQVLGPGRHGEVLVKHVDMFSYYLQAPKETNEAFTSDGYFRTGDIGFFDEQGFVTIVGRRKEIFKYFNNHISPYHIEDVLRDHPKVNEACVVGITAADGFNSVPRAYVTLKPSEKIADCREEIRTFAETRLPDYMHIKGGLFVVDKLPMNNTGKVTRDAVARLFSHLA